MSRIFVSYRREDDSGHAGRLYDRLAAHFGEGQVFIDVDSMEPGVDFVDVIEQTVGRVDAFIAVIGPEWVTCTDAAGSRRLDDPHDFVRLELAHALERDVRVVPVLVRGAEMPRAADLPDDLKPLVRRNALIMSDTEWHAAVLRLVESLDQALTRGAAASPRPTPERPHTTRVAPPAREGRSRALAAALGLLALLVLGAIAVAAITATNSGDETAVAPPSTVVRTLAGERVTVTAEPEAPPTVSPTVDASLSLSEARALQDESTRQSRLGNWARALELAQSALAALVGRDRTYEAFANFNIGNALAHLGRCAEALPFLDRREVLLGRHDAVDAARALCGA